MFFFRVYGPMYVYINNVWMYQWRSSTFLIKVIQHCIRVRFVFTSAKRNCGVFNKLVILFGNSRIWPCSSYFIHNAYRTFHSYAHTLLFFPLVCYLIPVPLALCWYFNIALQLTEIFAAITRVLNKYLTKSLSKFYC